MLLLSLSRLCVGTSEILGFLSIAKPRVAPESRNPCRLAWHPFSKAAWKKRLVFSDIFPTEVEFVQRLALETVRGLSAEARELLLSTTKSCFQLWKSECGEAPFVGTGILAAKPSWEKFPEAPPCQCAGQDVWNEIDLALRLLAESYEPFEQLCEVAGNENVVALLVLDSPKPTRTLSMLRAGKYMRERKIDRLRATVAVMDEDAVIGYRYRKRSSKGGQRGVESRSSNSEAPNIKNVARRLLQADEPRYGLARKIAAAGINLSERHINRILKEKGL